MTARFLCVRGRLQRQGLVVHVVAESFVDLTGELHRLRDGFDIPPANRDAYVNTDSRFIKSRDFH
jgi:error-prone DNA polymerase